MTTVQGLTQTITRSADRTTWKSDSAANTDAASKAKDIIINSCINSDRLPEQIMSTLGTTARSLKEGDKDSFNGWTSDPYSVDISIEGIGNEAFLTISLTRFQWTNDVGHGKKGFDLLPLNNEDVALFTNAELKPKDHLGSTPQHKLTFSFEDFGDGKKGIARIKLFNLDKHPYKDR